MKSKLKEEDNQLYRLTKGPTRPYVRTNKRVIESILEIKDKYASLLILSMCLFRIVYLQLPDQTVLAERDIIDAINGYNTGELFNHHNPPLVGLFFTIIGQLFGYGYDSIIPFSSDVSTQGFPLWKLRMVNEAFGMVSVLLFHKILRYNGVSSIVALFGTFLFGFENSIFTQFKILTTDSMYLMLITLFIAHNKLSKLKILALRSWIPNTLIASIALGLAISSHWSGIFLLGYSIVSLMLELWYNSDDLSISLRKTWTVFYFKLSCYIIIPITIYLSIYNIHFKLLTKVGSAYNSLSPEFQYSLENSHLEDTFLNVKFESEIMLRHYTTGAYLHSHSDYYAGSGYQQVTLLDNYNDKNNIFQVLPITGVNKNLFDYSKNIGSPWRVELKHVDTNSSLVIDGDYRPPLSDQDYNKQVTTDKNYDIESEEKQKRKQQFHIKISSKYSKTKESKKSLQVVNSVFQLYNERESCYLLGTPLLLSEGFSSGQKEVICIKEPNYEASLWYIDWNSNPNFSEDDEVVELPEFTFWDKVSEILLKNFKELFIGQGGYEMSNIYGTSIKNWVFLQKGYTHLIDYENKRVMYLLGNFITYHLIVVATFIYGILKLYQFITFNPFTAHESINQANFKYDREGFEYLVGYLMMLVPMSFIKIELHLFNYLPALVFGILFVTQTYQWLFEKCKSVALIIGAVLCGFIFLAFFKFSPIMVASEWTYEKCAKLMISPLWDNQLCEVYD